MESVSLTLGISVEKETIRKNIKRIINQSYKLLPLREEGKDWQKPLSTLIEEMSGMASLVKTQEPLFFSILCKMKGLSSLTEDSDKENYRRTILELLSLLGELERYVCD